MKKVRALFLFILMLALLTGSALALDRDIYIQLEGIPGVSKDPWHEKWIDVLSFSRGSSYLGPDGRTLIEPFTFKHLVDKATPGIQDAWLKGTVIPKATLEFSRIIDGKPSIYCRVAMEDITVEKAEVNVDDLPGGSFQLVETVHLAAKKAKWFYDPLPPNGDPDLPKTGDDSPLLLWTLLLAASCTALFVLRKQACRKDPADR